MRGNFISIEGIEGAGKSSLISGISDLLTSRERQVVCTREPGGTELGLRIRKTLLEKVDGEQLDPKAEVLMFSADRAQHLKSLILPSLNAGKFVVCDRFVHSTLAYQGYGRGMDLKELEQLCNFTIGSFCPDLVLLLDLDVETGLRRARERAKSDKDSWGRFEAEELDFHNRVRHGFLKLAEKHPEYIVTLDAEKTPAEILQSASEILINKFFDEK